MDNKIYYDTVIRQLPRILGQLDRNKNSKTYGCFDRNYWHYKVIDFACARHQEAALTLALLYKLSQKDNPYYKNKSILNWINAALKFWCIIQNKDGSLNEWYPNERSFVAAAFSSYAISESLILLGKEIKNKNQIINSLRKSAVWLSKRNEWNATNQMSGAILFLFNVYKLTNNKKYLKFCQEKLKKLISKQTPEGWWNEYNGADIGYHSLTIDYLSKLFKKYPDKKLKNAINKAIDFLSYFIHPNMTFGGEYGSRNTEFITPHGIELNTRDNKNALTIASALRISLNNVNTIAPYSIDDRYLCYISYVWLQAYLDSKKTLKASKYRFEKDYKKDFTGAKILTISNKNFYIIINYSKGGAFNLYQKKKKSFTTDSGIIAADLRNNNLTSSWIANNRIEKDKNSITIKGKMLKLKDIPMTTLKNISLKSFAKTFGNSPKLSSLMKGALRKKLITSSKKSNTNFEREFIIGENSIKIVDSLYSADKLHDISLGEKYSNLFIPSSRYFQSQELDNRPMEFVSVNKKDFKVERIFSSDNKLAFKVLN
jgi:hypothetical protein